MADGVRGLGWMSKAVMIAACLVVLPLDVAWGQGQYFNPPVPLQQEWAGEDRWNQPRSWYIWDPNFTVWLIDDPDNPSGDPIYGEPDDDFNYPFWTSLPDNAEDLNNDPYPSPATAGRPVFSIYGSSTSRVDSASLGKNHWEVYDITFSPGYEYVWEDNSAKIRVIEGNSYTLTGNALYVGAGGIQNFSTIQRIENDIWLWDDMTINGGVGLYMGSAALGDTEINNSRESAKTLTFTNWVHLGGFTVDEQGNQTAYGPIIRGDGDVVYAGNTFIFQDNEYTGQTILRGRVMIGANRAFGLHDTVRVEDGGGDSRISAFADPVIIPQKFDLYGDLHFGGTHHEYASGGELTFTGEFELHGGNRSLITEHAVPTLLEGPIELNNNALTLDGFGGSHLTVNGVIDGPGGAVAGRTDPVSIIKAGPGTVTLNGENTFTGDILLRDGIFELAHNSVWGDTSQIIVEGRTFLRPLQPIDIDVAVALEHDLDIIGEGLTFSAPIVVENNRPVALRLNSDVMTLVTEDSGIDLQNNLTIQEAGDMRVDAPITGPGSLTRRGIATDGDDDVLWLSAVNTYSGGTFIENHGSISLIGNGTLPGNVTVTEGRLTMDEDTVVTGNVNVGRFSSLEGEGRIAGNLTVDRRAVLRPGDITRPEGDVQPDNSLGTLRIDGNAEWLTGNPESRSQTIMQYVVNGENDRISVGGAAMVGEYSQFVVEEVGSGFAPGGDTFTLLDAGSLTIHADMDDLVISGTSLFLSYDAVNDGNNLIATSRRNPFTSQAQGQNNVTLSQALDGIVQGGNIDSETAALLIAIDDSPNSEAYNDNLRQLSPTTYTGGVNATVQAGRTFHQNMHQNARTTREGRMGVGYNAASSFVNKLGPTPWAMAAAQPYLWDDTYRDRLQDRPENRRRSWDEAPRYDERDAAASRRRSVNENRWNVFGNTYGAHERIDSESERPGLRANTAGFTVGADYSFTENFYLGGSAGYAYTDVTFRESRGDGTVHSFRAGPYLGWNVGDFTIDASATYGYHQNDYDQNVNIGSFTQEKNADFDAHDISAYVNVGYEIMLANRRTSFTPIASLNYTHYRRDSFTESGGGATNFDVASQTVDLMEGTIGVRFEHRYFTDGATIIPNAFLGYSYEFLGDDNDVEASFIGSPTSFTLEGPDPDRHALRVGAGVRALLSETVQGYLQYNGRFQSDQSGHAGIIGLSLQF